MTTSSFESHLAADMLLLLTLSSLLRVIRSYSTGAPSEVCTTFVPGTSSESDVTVRPSAPRTWSWAKKWEWDPVQSQLQQHDGDGRGEHHHHPLWLQLPHQHGAEGVLDAGDGVFVRINYSSSPCRSGHFPTLITQLVITSLMDV